MLRASWTWLVVLACSAQAAAQPSPSGPSEPEPEPQPQPEPASPSEPPPPAPPRPASPRPADPAPPPIIAPAPPVYPLALAARPLLLPTGTFEATADLTLGREDRSGTSGATDPVSLIDLVPLARVAAPGVELEGHMMLGLYESTSNDVMAADTTLAELGFSARHGLGADMAIGADLTLTTPAADASAYAPRAVFGWKHHFGARSAIELYASAGFERASLDTPVTTLFAGGEVRAQAQMSATFAVEARAALALDRRLHSDTDSDPAQRVAPATFTTQAFGIRGVSAMSPTLDFTFGFDALAFDPQATRFLVGFRVRRGP